MNCTSIGEYAFSSYYSINNLQFGNGVEHIPAGMPSLSMSWKKLVLPNSVKTIETGAFTGTCGAVVIGNGIENIATGAFPSGMSAMTSKRAVSTAFRLLLIAVILRIHNLVKQTLLPTRRRFMCPQAAG